MGNGSILTTRGRAFIAAGVVLALGGIFLGFEDLTRIGVVLIALPVLAWLIARRTGPPVLVNRQVQPELLSVDQRATVSMTFTNASSRPSRYFLATERLDYVLGDWPKFILPRIRSGEVLELTYAVRSHQRGEHTLGPLALQLRDPFGLTMVHLASGVTHTVTVLPRTVPLGATQPPGSGAGSEGETSQLVAVHGSDDASIRQYLDGDDLRKVHWPATAHRGELMVRQQDNPTRRQALLVLDSSASAHQGVGSTSSFEWAVSATASIAHRLNELGYFTHLVTAEQAANGACLQAQDSEQMLRALAVAALRSDEELDRQLLEAADLVRAGSLVVAVIADLSLPRVNQFAALRQTGASALAIVLDTASFAATSTTASSQASAVADVLAVAGWRVTIARGSTGIEAAWGDVGSRTLVRVGSL